YGYCLFFPYKQSYGRLESTTLSALTTNPKSGTASGVASGTASETASGVASETASADCIFWKGSIALEQSKGSMISFKAERPDADEVPKMTLETGDKCAPNSL